MQKKYTDEELLDNLKLVANNLGHIPLKQEYSNHPLAIASADTLCYRFGNNQDNTHCTWANVCKKINLLIPMHKGIHPVYRYLDINDKEQIKKQMLEEIYQELINHPDMHITSVLKKYCKYNAPVCKYYLGSVAKIQQLLYTNYGIKTKVYTQYRIKWTKQIVEEEYRRIEALLNRRPLMKDMHRYSFYKDICHGIIKTHKTFAALTYAMGYLPRNNWKAKNVGKLREQYFISLLREVAKKENIQELSIRKMYKKYSINKGTIRRIFGNVENWFEKAKIKVPQSWIRYHQKRLLTDKKIVQNLRKVAKENNGKLSLSQYDKSPNAICSSATVLRRFSSWNNALKIAKIKQIYKIKISDEEIISALQKIAKELKHVPSCKEYNMVKRSPYIKTIQNHFGSWNNALKAAGLK